jgi:hypothetical protein
LVSSPRRTQSRRESGAIDVIAIAMHDEAIALTLARTDRMLFVTCAVEQSRRRWRLRMHPDTSVARAGTGWTVQCKYYSHY